MGKTLLLLSFLGLAFLMVGSFLFPDHIIFWFASTSHGYQYLRLILASVLGLQLVTQPPRHLIFRIIAGAMGVIVIAWVLQETYDYHMQLLDCLSLLSGAIAILITALERRTEILLVRHAHS